MRRNKMRYAVATVYTIIRAKCNAGTAKAGVDMLAASGT
jgi:hypothetical protein